MTNLSDRAREYRERLAGAVIPAYQVCIEQDYTAGALAEREIMLKKLRAAFGRTAPIYISHIEEIINEEP